MAKYYNVERYENYRQLINDAAANFGRRTAFFVRAKQGGYRSITFKVWLDKYYKLCTYLLDSGYKGRRIAISGANSWQWITAYLAASTVGVAVPLDKELSAEDICGFSEAADCVLAFCDDAHSSFFPEGVCVITFDKLDEMTGEDAPLNKQAVDDIEIGRDEVRIIIFTSGTTGSAKGVCLSQYNICTNIWQTEQIVKIRPRDRVMSILPLHHTYECTLDHLLVLSRGACVTYADSLKRIAKNIKEYKPTVLVVVPALLGVLSRRIKKSVAQGVPDRYKSYFDDCSFSEAMGKLPAVIRSAVKRKVRKTLGGSLHTFIVGAADIDTALISDFEVLGVRTLQGYGLTECSPLLAGNSDFHYNPASTGIAVPGVELKIDEPNAEGVGEILAKGDNIMLCYFEDEEATARAFKDGWFRTGDLGYIDENGDLFIKGRIKNVIVTENGKNIYPEELETRLAKFEEVGEVLVIPAQLRGATTVKAKILPNLEFLEQQLGYEPEEDELRAILQRIVNQVNSMMPSYKHIHVLEVLKRAFEKTTTQKIKRFGQNMDENSEKTAEKQ